MEVGKNTLDLAVRNKTFKIEFISNWVIYQYEQHNKKIFELQKLYEELEGIPDKDRIKEIVSDIQELGKNVLNEKLEIVEEILTSNELEFDRKWWERRTNADDINQFMHKCVFKDIIKTSKKKM